MAKVQPIPAGFEKATPYLCCKDAARALEFYKKAFGAQETMRLAEDNGRIGHAEFTVGKALLMLSDEHPEIDIRGPQSLGGTPVSIVLYVEDVDAVVKQAVAAGAKLERPAADQFYGDRTAVLKDPFGHRWHLATHIEDVSSEEMKKRYDNFTKQQGA